jgi:hypothetical protein
MHPCSITAYLWSREPSSVFVRLGRGWSGPVGPELGRVKTASTRWVTLLVGSWLVKAASGGLRSGEGSRSTWLRSSCQSRWWQPAFGCLGIPSSRPTVGGEHEAVRSRPSGAHSCGAAAPVVGHAVTRAARWPWPDLIPPRRGSGFLRRAARRTRVSTGVGRRRRGRCCDLGERRHGL